jgi:hypothetical protein
MPGAFEESMKRVMASVAELVTGEDLRNFKDAQDESARLERRIELWWGIAALLGSEGLLHGKYRSRLEQYLGHVVIDGADAGNLVLKRYLDAQN